MKIETEELSGKALDWAVATSQGWLADEENGDWIFHCAAIISIERYAPSVDWAQGGPLIDECDVWVAGPTSIDSHSDGGCDVAWVEGIGPTGVGETKLIAAMRAIVAAKLGEEVDVPNELIN